MLRGGAFDKAKGDHVVIYYFLAIIVALIIVFVLIERDAF